MKNRAFTLIELLIVVAIIAILAAIAVPNFLEAQVRAKAARSKSDLRTYVTGLEAYAVDHSKYPPPGDRGPALSMGPPAVMTGFHTRLSNYVTTPVAYLTSVFEDPFIPKSTFFNTTYPESTRVGFRYVYYNAPWNVAANGGNDVWNKLEEWMGVWTVFGYGPDKTPFGGPAGTLIPYDATNGTVSVGNIVRSQRSIDGTPIHPRTKTFNW